MATFIKFIGSADGENVGINVDLILTVKPNTASDGTDHCSLSYVTGTESINVRGTYEDVMRKIHNARLGG